MKSGLQSLRRILLVAALAVTALASRPIQAQGTIKIAMMGPITGQVASIGLEQLNFAKLAFEDFKKASNMTNIELVEVDTELDPAKATTAAQRVIADEAIVGVVGPAGSQEVEAITPLMEQAGLVFISPSATRTSLTEKGVKTFFRVVPRDDVQGPTIARFMAEQLKATKIYIIDDQTSYSTGLAEEAIKALDELKVAYERASITQKDTDFAPLVTKMKTSAPDVVFIPIQFAIQAVQIGQQMKEQGVAATLVGGDGMFAPEEFIKNAGGITEGAYVSFFAPDLRGIPEAADVVKAYTSQYGDFGSFGGPTYVGTKVLLEAVGRAAKAGAPTRASVLEEVKKTDEASSIFGIPIKFDTKNDIAGAQFFIFQVKGNKFELVASSAMEAAPTPAATEAK